MNCSQDECTDTAKVKGLCQYHYHRHWTGKTGPERRRGKRITGGQCLVPNCPNPVLAKELCQRHYRIKRNYGLPPAEMAVIGTACAACDSTEKLHVDHDHTTGKVRGLLCHGCNIALGMAKDNPRTLRNLASYLEG